MFWIDFAVQLAAPQPVNYSALWSANDMPYDVMNAGITRVVGIRVTVRPDGSIQDCGVESGSGNANLDALTCEIVVKRARFRAAQISSGSPTYGAYRTKVTWAINASPPLTEHHGDMDISVSRLPEGMRSPSFVRVVLAVDEKGRPSSCSLDPFQVGTSIKSDPTLVAIACERLVKDHVLIPVQDHAGKPVASVQNASVRFSTEK